MGFGKHKHTGMDKTISGGGGYEGIYFYLIRIKILLIRIYQMRNTSPLGYVTTRICSSYFSQTAVTNAS